MKRTAVIFLLLAVASVAAMAQDGEKVKVKPYGFVRNYLNFDSRQTYTVIGGEYHMLPYDREIRDGVDLNAVPHAQLQALTSRIGLALTGPQWLGMQSSGRVEGDFGGFGSNNTVLRLRLAYVKLSRQTEGRYGEVLLGQDWHPLSGEVMPEVLGMAAGAPFRPHSRTPQLRATAYWGSFGLTAALLYQLQYMNNGPTSATDATSTASISFANNALLPEAFLGVNFKSRGWYAQLGIDGQTLRPRTHAVGTDGKVHKVDEHVWSLTPTAYAQYVSGMWSVKCRTLLAANTSHLNQLVGYAVVDADADGTWHYSPLRAAIGYLNLAYGKKVRGNLFLGYMQNLGSRRDLWLDPTTGSYHIYMKGGETFTHLHCIWRIAPSVSYNARAFNLGLEYELTGAAYGNIGPNGRIRHDGYRHTVVGHRVCALVKYNF
ncbi:MAG: hypothetical protein IJU19_05580 [Bacteroidales bacterium]|nr:hypothetical protein [Bacteroidales bacterium]